MNKKVLSTSLSLACHTIFLIIAFTAVFTAPSVSAPTPPLLIHVHLDARPFSPSMGNNNKSAMPQKKLSMAKPMKIKKTQKNKKVVPHRQHLVAKNQVVSVVKPHAHTLRQTSYQQKGFGLLNTKEIFKDMSVAHKEMVASPIMPMANQTLPLPQKPSLTSEIATSYQGETPYLPFDENGSGTDIKSFMGYNLETYEDPDDHLKYFKLSIRVEEIPGSLPTLPKEITFIIDASNSIGLELLQHFGIGVVQSLQQLNWKDKFNVMVFNDTINKMQPAPIDNNPQNLQQAQAFLSDLKPRSTTDLYETVLQSIDTPHTLNPAYLFLLSDGEPTVGVTDPVQIINQIGRINDGRVPIFGLGAGFPNKYFMNFITFTNHGWAEFGPPITAEDSIVQLYNHIKDPMLTHLRYFSIGLHPEEIYPKLLPDLFKGSEFVLYGQYTHEGDFTLELRGNSGHDIKKYVIKDNLNNGRGGERTIAEAWAMRKIIDLIGRLQYNQNNQAIIDEVNELALKFNLKIPAYKAQ